MTSARALYESMHLNIAPEMRRHYVPSCCFVPRLLSPLIFTCAQGKGFAINVPLKDGIQDDPFLELFTSIVDAAVKRFRPNAVVMQCGGGSLAGDRVGSFNLTHVGHCA